MMSFDKKEQNGINFIEQAAATLSSQFFIDCAEGRDIETDHLYLMDFSGWLVPNEKAVDFSHADRWNDEWQAFFVFAQWEIYEGDIKINFNKYPQYECNDTSNAHRLEKIMHPIGA